MPSERRFGKIAVAIISGLVLVAGGGVAGILLFPAPVPEPLQRGIASTSFDVEESSIEDPHTVQVSLDVSEDSELSIPLDGRVTENICSVGATISSGQVIAQVSGDSVLALHTSIPLWESLTVGDNGDDVNALRGELIRMGADLVAEGPVNRSMINIVASLLAGGEEVTETLEEIPVERILWLPQQNVTMLKCGAVIGKDLTKGEPFGTVAGALNAARVVEVPPDAIPGERVLQVAGGSVTFGDDGVVSQEGVSLISESLDYKALRDAPTAQGDAAPSTLIGTLVLAEPTQAWSVPASTVFEVSGTYGCISSRGQTVPVKIVGSRLGKTFVLPAEESVILPAKVDLPANNISCRENNETPAE